VTRKRCTLAVSAIAAAVAVAVPAGAAEAKTYCVHKLTTTCAAGSVDVGDSVQYALNLAAADTEADTVKIGPGTYTGPSNGWDAVNDNPLTVSGAGMQKTILDGSGQTVSNPALRARSATLERFKLIAPEMGMYQKGITTRLGIVRDVTVADPGKMGQGIVSQGSSLLRVAVDVTGEEGIGVLALPEFVSTSVTASTLTADAAGVAVNKGSAFVTRTRMNGGGATTYGGPLTVSNSVIKLGESDNDGVSATCAEGVAMTSLTADHLTVLGGSATDGAAAQCYASGKAKVTVKNSILATGRSLVRTENAGQTDILAYSNLLNQGNTGAVDGGPGHAGKISLGTNLLGSPTFLPGTVLLPSGSFLIDKATPSPTDVDVNNKPRHVDLDGDGVAEGDIGATERQVK
jgi:hypothetical protein